MNTKIGHKKEIRKVCKNSMAYKEGLTLATNYIYANNKMVQKQEQEIVSNKKVKNYKMQISKQSVKTLSLEEGRFTKEFIKF